MLTAWFGRRLAAKVVDGRLSGKEIAAAALVAQAVETNRTVLTHIVLEDRT